MPMAYGDGTYITNKSGTITLQKYYGTDVNGKKIYKKFTAKNKTAAKEKARKYEESLISIDNFDNNKMLFVDYIQRWTEVYKRNSVKATTYNSIEDCINSRIRPYNLAYYQMSQLNSDVMQHYINQLVDNKYSRATIVKTYNTINSCLKFALAKGDIKSNPMLLVTVPSEEKVLTKEKMIEFFTIQDVQKIVLEVQNHQNLYRYGYEIIFLIYTGLRIGEACALCWKDVDFENKKIYINSSSSIIQTQNETKKTKEIITSPKTAKGKRIVYLTKQAYNSLLKIKEKNSKYCNEADRVFLTSSGTPLNRRNLRRSLNSLQRNIGTSIQNSGLHTLRHTFATLAISQGVDLKTIAQVLGHSKVSTTYNIYVHFIENNAIQALSALDDLQTHNKLIL